MPRLFVAALFLSAFVQIPAAHARNVILFVGKGMDPTMIAAARTESGLGEDDRLSFEDFPASAPIDTRDESPQPDISAGAMSAIMTGTATRATSLGMDAIPELGQCSEAQGHELPTLSERAKAAGLAVGLVSTSRVTHPMPAATYAHVTDTNWEVDVSMPKLAKEQGCHDIAYQLVDFHHGSGLDVVLGGGSLAFMTKDQQDPIQAERRGVRMEDRLIETWQQSHADGRFVYTRDDLEKAIGDVSSRGPIFGLFAPDHMRFESERISSGSSEPSLTEMTRAAIARLSREQRGYVLVIVAGGIERAQSIQRNDRAVVETTELSNAVREAMQTTDAEDTLIVVTTADGKLPVYARGPGSESFEGVIELTHLHASMTAALGLR